MVQYLKINNRRGAVATLDLKVEERSLIEQRKRIILERSCRSQYRKAANLNSSNKKGLGQYKP